MALVIVLGVAILIATPFILALFVNKEYSIQRTIVISQPKLEVFNYIKYLKNQERYNKWVMTDPNMKKTLSGTDGTEGFIYAWDGNKQAGKGEQEITKIVDGDRIEHEIR